MAIPFDPRLPAHLIDLLAQRGTVRKLGRNTTVVHEGEPGKLFYVVLSGRARAFVSDPEGRRMTLEELREGQYFGEMALDGGPRAASILTLCETRLLSVPRRDFLELLAERPEFAKHLLMRLSARVRLLSEQVKGLALMDVQERVVTLLRSLGESEDTESEVRERLTQQAIAERVGASRSMINRVLKSMLQEGRLRMQGDSIVLTKASMDPIRGPSPSASSAAAAPLLESRVMPKARSETSSTRSSAATASRP